MTFWGYAISWSIVYISYVAQGGFLYTVLDRPRSFRRCMLYYLPFAAFIVAINLMHNTFWKGIPGISIALIAMEFCLTVLLWKWLSGAKLVRVLLTYLAGLVLCAAGNAVGRVADDLIARALQLGSTPQNIADDMERLTVTLCQCAMLAGAARAYRRIFKKKIGDVRWIAFALILFAEMFGVIIISYIIFWMSGGFAAMLVNLAYVAVCAFADWYLFKAFRDMVKSAELEQDMRLLEQRQAMQQEAYTNLSEQILQLRRMRHDYVNTLETIGALLAGGDTTSAAAFTAELKSAVQQKGTAVFTGHQVVDAVLTNKQQAAEERGVVFRVEMLWPEEPVAADADLMSLFANLLDNALAYLETLPEGAAREICVSTRMQGRMLLVDVANTYLLDEPPIAGAENAEKAAHGYGLGIVKSIAERSGGALIATCSGGMLHMSVLLGGTETPAASKDRQ